MTVQVVLPTYRANPEYLREALSSLFSQTHTDWKLFISDDASSSSIPSLFQDVLSDPRVTLVQHSSHLGMAGNWNLCREYTIQSSAPLTAFLFQDDTWNADYLASACAIFEQHSHVGMVSLRHHYGHDGSFPLAPAYTDYETWISEHPSTVYKGTDILQQWLQMGLYPNIVGEPSFVVLCTDVLRALGSFPSHFPQCLDIAYFLRVLKQYDWYMLSDRSYGCFRVHTTSTSSVNEHASLGKLDRLRVLLHTSRSSLLPSSVFVEGYASFFHRFFHRNSSHLVSTSSFRLSFFLQFLFLSLQFPLLTIRAVFRCCRERIHRLV